MAWEVELTDQFQEWYLTLSEAQQDALDAAVRVLERSGPATPRPLVDRLTGSRMPNLKEMRVSKGGALRVLFAFDPGAARFCCSAATRRGDGPRGT